MRTHYSIFPKYLFLSKTSIFFSISYLCPKFCFLGPHLNFCTKSRLHPILDLKFPVPFVANRDYVYTQRFQKVAENITVCTSTACESDIVYVPPRNGKIRVKEYSNYSALVETETGTKVVMHS